VVIESLETRQLLSGTTTGNLTPVVTRSTLPPAVVAGTRARGSATVSLSNAAASTVRESVTTQVYASLDGAVDTASVLVGTLTRTVAVKADGSSPVTVAVDLPSSTAAGTYTLLAKTTDTAGTTSATTGPSLAVAAPFVSFTDETLTSDLSGPVVNGTKTKDTASLTLTNSGNIASTGDTTVELLLSEDGTVSSGTKIRTITEPIVLKPGQTKTVKFALETLPSVSDGTYEIVARVTDPEGNATGADTLTTVNPAAAFDSLTPDLSSVAANGTFSLTVTNNGNIVPVGATTIELFASPYTSVADGTSLITASVKLGIAPGASKVFRFHLTSKMFLQLTLEPNLVAEVTDPMNQIQTASTKYVF
jgi:hypothetical protein